MTQSNSAIQRWIPVARAEEVPMGQTYEACVDGKHYALFNVDGTVYACDGLCTHGQAYLAEGYLLGDEIECPMHAGRFNVRTGEVTCGPATKDIGTYPVDLRDGQILIGVKA